MMRRLMTATTAAAVLALVACGDGASPTSPTTTTATSTTELFTGGLSPGGSAFYSFTVANAGTVAVTLASTATLRIGPAASIPLTIALGTPSGFGCSPGTTVVTAPGLTAQLSSASVAAGIYCVNVSEGERLGGDLTFVVRIVHT
jgi:hypothetical protein